MKIEKSNTAKGHQQKSNAKSNRITQNVDNNIGIFWFIMPRGISVDQGQGFESVPVDFSNYNYQYDPQMVINDRKELPQ